MLHGTITALVTPMTNNGEIDFVAFAQLIEQQISGGVTGLVVIGSTGESSNLTDDEKFALIHSAIKIINKRVKVIVGLGCINTPFAITCVNALNQIPGVDYIMALTPPYVKPTQEGLYQHFATIAKLSTIPIILYNVPGRTSCDLEDKTTLRLADDFPNIIGLKDATGNIARCCYLVKYKPKDFILISGDDATAMAFVLCGGSGVISVVSNLVPKQFSQMVQLALDGNIRDAIKINNQILELHSLLFIESNPIPVKWALYHEGILNSPECRLPLTTLSEPCQARILPHITRIMIDEK